MNNKIELFGKEIELRTHNCHLFGQEAEEFAEPTINLYVRTKYCNAKCLFCTYADDASKYNEKKFIEVLKELSSKIKIRKKSWDTFGIILARGLTTIE